MAFDINAQIILSGPKGLTKVRNKIKKDLSSVSVPVKLDFDKGGGKALRDINSQINTLNKSFSQFNSNAQKVSKSIKQAGDNSRRSISNVNSLANTTANLSKNLSKASKDAKKAATEIEAFGKDAALAIRRFSAFTLATGAVFGFVRAVQEGISKGIEFERQIVRLQQVTGSSKAQIQSLDRAIGNLAGTLGISQIELAQTAVTLAQTGQSIREVEQSLRAISKASLAPTFGDIKSTTEGVIAALRQFNISASKTEEVLGSLNNVAKRFAVESEDLVSVIRRAGGVFAQASQDIQQGPQQSLNELLAIFTSVRSTTRETADTIATGLRTIFSRLQRKSTIEFLKSFDIQLLDSKDNFIGFFNSFREISTKLEGLGTIELAQVVEELGGIRQIGKILPAIKNFGSVTENAFKVAQQGAKQGLSKDVARAADTLSVKISALSENFSTLIKNITQSKTFQTFAKTAVSVANGFIKTVDALRPLLPLLATLGGIKLIDLGGEFFKGFKDGITKTKDIIDKTEEALDSINKKGGGDSSSGGGGGGGGPIGPDSKLLDALKGNTTALTSNTQALIRNSNLLDKLTRLGIGSNVAKVSDEKSKKKTADKAIAAIPTDPAEALLQNIEETVRATSEKSKEEFQQVASNAEKKKFIRERAGSKESAVKIPFDVKALAASTTKAVEEANKQQSLTTSNRSKALAVGATGGVGGRDQIRAISGEISRLESSNEKLIEELADLQTEFSDDKGKLLPSAGKLGDKGSVARRIEKLESRIKGNEAKKEELKTKRDNIGPTDVASLIQSVNADLGEIDAAQQKAKQNFIDIFKELDRIAAQQKSAESLKQSGVSLDTNRITSGELITSLPQEPVEPIVVTDGSDIDDKRRFKNTSTPVGNLDFGFKNRQVEEGKQKRLTTEESSTSRGVKTRKQNEEQRNIIQKQIISNQEELKNSFDDANSFSQSFVFAVEEAAKNGEEIANKLQGFRDTLPSAKAAAAIEAATGGFAEFKGGLASTDTGAGQNTSRSVKVLGKDAQGDIQREAQFTDEEKAQLESSVFTSDVYKELQKKRKQIIEKAAEELKKDEDDYILALGGLYNNELPKSLEEIKKAAGKLEAQAKAIATPNIPIAKVNTPGDLGAIKFAKGGFVKGPSHSQGGVPAELEGGEFVVPKKNVDQKTGLPKFQNGGSFDDLPEVIKEQAKIAAESGKSRLSSVVGARFGKGSGTGQDKVFTDFLIVDNKPEETGALIGPDSEKNNTGFVGRDKDDPSIGGNISASAVKLLEQLNPDIVIPKGKTKVNVFPRGGYGAFGFKETAVDEEGNLTFGGKKEKGRSNVIFDQMKQQIKEFASNLIGDTVPLLNEVLGLGNFFKPISTDSGDVLDEKIIQETFNSLKGAVSESLASVISGSELQGQNELFDLKDLDATATARLSSFFESPPGASITELKRAEVKANLGLARAPEGGLISKVVNKAISDEKFQKNFEVFASRDTKDIKGTTPFEILPQDEKSRGGLTFTANSLLTPGELVFNPKLAEKIGLQNLKKFNRTGDSSLIRSLLGSDISKIATVPGKGNKDTFPATLDRGSFVIKKDSSEKSGLQNFNTGGLFGVQSFQNGGQSSGGTAFFSELAKNVGKATIAFGSLKSVDFSNIGEVISIVPILSAGLEGLFDSFSDATDALLSDEEKKVAEKIEAVDGEIASLEAATEATGALTEAVGAAAEGLTELPDKIAEAAAKAETATISALEGGADAPSVATNRRAGETLEQSVVKKPDKVAEIDRSVRVKKERAARNEKRKNLTRQERRELIANNRSRRIRKQDDADRAIFDKDIEEAETRVKSSNPAEARKGKRDLAQLKQNKEQFFNLSPEARLGEKGFTLKKGDKDLGRKRRSKKSLLSFDDLLPKLGGGGKGGGGLKGIFSKLAGKITSSDKSKSFVSDIASKGVSKVRDAGFRGIPEDLFGDGFRDGIKKLGKKGNFKKISKGFFTDLVDQFKDPKKLKGAFKKGKSIPGIIAAVLADPIINTIGDKVGLKEIGGAKGFESGSTVAAGAFGAASGAAKGAAIGAGIGSLIPIPVVGTVVGAIGGAIVGGIDGLFSGIKDQKIFNALTSLDKAAKAASEALGDLGDVEKLDINKDQEKIGKFLTAQEKLTSSVITTSKKLDEIENGGLKAAEGGEGGIPDASVIGGVLGGPVGVSVGAAIDLAESKTISSAFASSEEALTGWSQSLKENSGNKIAQFLQPFVNELGVTSLGLKNFASSIEDAITQSSLYQNTIGTLNSITSSVSGVFSVAGSLINQQGITGAASTAIGGSLSFATAGISDEIKGLFTGQSGQEVADDRIASVQGAVFLDQQTQAVESFITSVNLLDTEKLKETGDALQQLGAKSLDSIFAVSSSAKKLAQLDLSDIEDFNDLENTFKELTENSDPETLEQTAKIFKNIATNAAQLEAADLEKQLAGIAGEDADFKEALKPFQQANSVFLSTLQKGGDIRKASKARADNLLATLGAKVGTEGGVRDIVKGVKVTERDEQGRAIKDEKGNVVTKAADASNLDDVFAAIEQILAAGDKADPEKLAAVTAALGGNASEAANVFQALKASTGAQQDQTFAQIKATLAAKQRDEQIRSSLKLFDAFGTAIDKLNKGVSSLTDKFTTVADNINSEVEKILSGDTSITASAKFNPFENIDAASREEIKQGVANISATVGPGGDKALAETVEVLDFGKNLESSFTKLIDNIEADLGTGDVKSGDITASGIRKRFEEDNADELDDLPKDVREKFLAGLEASVGASRQDGGTIGIKELKESLVSGDLTAGIDQFTDQTAAALAEVTNSLNVLNAAVINAANVQSEIAQIETQKRLTIIGQREAFEDKFNKFLNQSVNVREQAEERLRNKLEATVNAGGAGARGAAAAGVGETDVLSAASLSDRRERLQAERESLKRRLGEASGQEGLAGGALQEEDTDQLIKALADNQQALQGTSDALQQLGDDVTQLAAIESELAKLQESQLTGQQKAASLARKLGDAKTPQERQKIIEEANKPIAALGKAKRLAAGEDVGDFSFDELADLLSLDDFTRQQFGVSDEDFANLKQVASTAVGEGIKDVKGGEVLGDAIVRSQDVDDEKQQLLDDAAAIQKGKEGAVESQANDKITALDAQFVLLTDQVTTTKNALAELTKTVLAFRGGGPNTPDTNRFEGSTTVAGASTSTNAFASIAEQFDPDVVSAANAAFNDGADPADIARSNAIASSLRDGGSNGIAAPNTLFDINALKPDVNKIAQQNAVNKIFEEQPTQQQFLKQTQAERVDRARDKNPLRNRRDSRLGKEIPKALDQGGSVLNDSAEKLLQASQALSGENQFADKVSQAAEKLANLPELKVDLNAQVGTVDVVLNGGALMTSFGEKVKNDVLAAVAEQLKGMQTPDGSLSDPRLS